MEFIFTLIKNQMVIFWFANSFKSGRTKKILNSESEVYGGTWNQNKLISHTHKQTSWVTDIIWLVIHLKVTLRMIDL